jgi:phage/plasmid-associated DNA primase
MGFDWQKFEEDKRARRARLRALPFLEKMRIVEQMRDGALQIKAAMERQAFVTKVMKGETDYHASNDDVEAQARLDRP